MPATRPTVPSRPTRRARSVTGSDPAAVANEASFFTTQVPVLWQPVLDDTWAWKTNISATEPQAFENLTQHGNSPQFWYTTKS